MDIAANREEGRSSARGSVFVMIHEREGLYKDAGLEVENLGTLHNSCRTVLCSSSYDGGLVLRKTWISDTFLPGGIYV